MRNERLDLLETRKTSEPPDEWPENAGLRNPVPAPIMTMRSIRSAFMQALIMLRPDIQKNNPTMFVVEIAAVLTLLCILPALVRQSHGDTSLPYLVFCDAALFLTVISANFATALTTARLARRDCCFQPPQTPQSPG